MWGPYQVERVSPASALDRMRIPIVQAPLGGGPSTPLLAAAVSEAGGLGFLAAGYKTVAAVEEDLAALRDLTSRSFGLNLFVPDPARVDGDAIATYASRVAREASDAGLVAGSPEWDDDWFSEKVQLVLRERPPVVSFTFGLPTAELLGEMREAGIETWVTVTEPAEADAAEAAGAAALIVQGFEAGGHRGSFADRDGEGEVGLLALLRIIAGRVAIPLVASGGIADGHAVAAVLVAGAQAAQLGTAFLDTVEAGTSQVHRARLREGGRTAITRAFTGRRARGIYNGFMARNSTSAPSAYPQIHNLTAPLRAAARARGDGELVNLWAGQAYQTMTHGLSATEVMGRLAEEMGAALERVANLGG